LADKLLAKGELGPPRRKVDNDTWLAIWEIDCKDGKWI
jgi:hypothetical protein